MAARVSPMIAAVGLLALAFLIVLGPLIFATAMLGT
jgi:hypothetical protein